MQRKRNVETVIWCSKCTKNIKVANYRVHVWNCLGSDKINPVIQNMFKSQLKMSRNLQSLIKSKHQVENNENIEVFLCEFCHFKMKYSDFDTHPTQCKEIPIQCPYCKDEFPKSLMDYHQEVCQQKKKGVRIPLTKSYSFPTPKMEQPKPILVDQQTVDQHVDFIFRELAHNLGVAKSRALTNKQLINLHQSVYLKKVKNQQLDVCSICDIDFQQGQKLVTLPCKHQYHRRCICHWFSVANTCPMCRYQMQKIK